MSYRKRAERRGCWQRQLPPPHLCQAPKQHAFRAGAGRWAFCARRENRHLWAWNCRMCYSMP